MERFSNFAQSTITGAIDGSTNPVTFSVDSASAFPANGNFRVIIDNEILLVTSVTGAAFTATRAQEGTSIAAHSSGIKITHILTAKSLENIIGQNTLSDTFANRPTAAIPGRLYYPTDEALYYRDTGSAWQMILPNCPPLNKPDISLLPTAINQGTSVFGYEGDRYRMLDDGSAGNGEHWRIKAKTITGSVSAEITIAAVPYFNNRAYVCYGPMFRNSSTGTMLVNGIISRSDVPNYYAFKLTNYNTFAQNYLETRAPISLANLIYMRTKFTFPYTFETFYSVNGIDWIKQCSFTDSNLAGMDQMGIAINNPVPVSDNLPIIIDIYKIDLLEI